MSRQHGYTLVEILVAMAVTSIVLAGTYAAYGIFARQQQLVLSQTELSRNAMRAVDLMQTDIRMAGFKDINDPDAMLAAQPIVIAQNSPGDLRLVYDDYDTGGSVKRMLTRYYTKTYTAAESGLQRDRILRQVRRCNDPAVFCDLNSSTLTTTDPDGEPLLDWVNQFVVTGQNPKSAGTFKNQFQTLKIVLILKSPRKLEGATKDTTKNFSFVARAKNVSLVP
ncbi:MAG: PilW family protein [Fluviibacter sp.]